MEAKYFVGIGAPRSGSTWLSEYLACHPQVAFSPIKELHYFDVVYREDLCSAFNDGIKQRLERTIIGLRETSDVTIVRSTIELIRCLSMRLEMIENPKRYQDYFYVLCEDFHRVCGEITPAYSLLRRDGFGAILDLFKEAKFLYVLRDPVDQYWSTLKFWEKRQTVPGFKAIDNVQSRLSDPKFLYRVNYQRTMTELFSVVPREQVIVVFYEHLMSADTHEKELRRITKFLGINSPESNLSERLNSSYDGELSDLSTALISDRFHRIYDYIFGEFGDEVPQRWHEHFPRV